MWKHCSNFCMAAVATCGRRVTPASYPFKVRAPFMLEYRLYSDELLHTGVMISETCPVQQRDATLQTSKGEHDAP